MEQLLIVEDVKGIREVLQEILEFAGYDVITAKNGKEGLEAILKYNPSVVLCDVYMPELDGFEMLSELNKHPVSPVFIFLTARVEKQAILKGMALGANAYINKPFDHVHLIDTIKSELQLNKADLKNHLSKVRGEDFAEQTTEILELLKDETEENYQIITL